MEKNNITRNFFLLTIFCMPLYLVRFSFFGLPTNLFEALVMFCLALFFINKKEYSPKNSCGIQTSFLTASFLVVTGTFLSIIFNDNWAIGFGILKGWFLIPALFSMTLYCITDSELFIEKIFRSIYFSTVLVGAIGLAYKIMGVVAYDNRLSAFYSSPNYLAMYLVPGIFFGLYFSYRSFIRDHFSKQSLFYLITLVSLLAPLYYTYSYGAWLSIMGSFLLLLFILIKDKRLLISYLLVISLIFAALFAFQLKTQKLENVLHFSERSSMASRIIIWNSSLALIKNNSIIGIGPGNFQNAYLSLQPQFPPYLEWAVPQPHNLFLAFWLQAGMIGFVGFLWLLFLIFQALFHVLKNNKDVALATPLLGFFLYTVLHGLIDTPYWKNDLAFLFWVCMILTISIKKYPNN